MAIVGIDDTDSRERGMCTTYLAARIADALDAGRPRLVRLNPAIEHKTRGNAACAVHATDDPERALAVARDHVERFAAPDANPGVVVGDGTVPDPVAGFCRDAIRDRCRPSAARRIAGAAGYETATWGSGRGIVGALAAVGSDRAVPEWTYEHIAYRAPDRRGTDRRVDRDALFDVAASAYPGAWDTVDRTAGAAVCVPHTPGPVLYGIRGEAPDVVRDVADRTPSEPVERRATFATNQGTDAHLRDAPLEAVRDGRSYRVDGRVAAEPETREGGHVHLTLVPPGTTDGRDRASAASATSATGPPKLPCVAFEPTGRFRDRVRALRRGDLITACGEVARGTMKLEKFAVRDRMTTRAVPPTHCGRRMESAGRDQGYRCRECDATAAGHVTESVTRELDPGWYEVPPRARRHVARPLVRGGFDAPTHPER